MVGGQTKEVMIMWQLLGLSLLQSVMLALGQLGLKVALEHMPPISWTLCFVAHLLSNWWFLFCGIMFGGASLLWMYILKHWPLSMAYPMVSMSYVIAMVMAVVFLDESIAWNRWVGVGLIMLGCVLVAK